MRADVLLALKGYAESRNKARSLIDSGCVYSCGTLVRKASADLPEDADISVVTVGESFVGRGALKLVGALADFGVDPAGMKCLDIGASTGGFTDCLLRRGAVHVTAVDCGRGQLASSLMSDSRVTSIEGCNARYITPDDVGSEYDLCVMDVSFISQTYILPALKPLLKPNGIVIALIKPQFELDSTSVSKGVVKSPEKRLRALCRVYDSLDTYGLAPIAFIRSPIMGSDGNVEYFGLYKLSNGISDNIRVFDRAGLRTLAFMR